MTMEKQRRADLESMPIDWGMGFIAAEIAPAVPVKQVAGNIYAQPLVTASVQSGRSPASNISSTQASANAVAFQCAEKYSRVFCGYSEEIGFGGRASAEIALARMARRAWTRTLETNVATTLFTLAAGSPVDGSADIIGTIDAEVAKLRELTGDRIALVVPNYIFQTLKTNATVIARMQATGVGIGELGARHFGAEQFAAMVGADVTLVGHDSCWGSTALDAGLLNRIAVVALPNPEVLPAETPQALRTVSFDWGDTEVVPYIIEEFENYVNDTLNLDCKGLYVVKELNASLKSVISVASSSSSSASA